MSFQNMKGAFAPRHDTEENWDSVSLFIPERAELIVYDPDAQNSGFRFKFGDGENLPKDLPFATTDVDLTGYATEAWVQNYVTHISSGDAVVSPMIVEYINDIPAGDNFISLPENTFIDMSRGGILLFHLGILMSPEYYSFDTTTNTIQFNNYVTIEDDEFTIAQFAPASTVGAKVSGTPSSEIFNDYEPVPEGEEFNTAVPGNAVVTNPDESPTDPLNYMYNHVEGASNRIASNVCHVEGSKNIVKTTHPRGCVHIEGYGNLAAGPSNSSHLEGQYNTAWRNMSHLEGYCNTSLFSGAHMEGGSTNIASDIFRGLEDMDGNLYTLLSDPKNGSGTTDYNLDRITPSNDRIKTLWLEGGTYVSKAGQGDVTTFNPRSFSLVRGNYGHKEGFNNIAIGNNTHVEGEYNIVAAYSGHVEGSTNSLLDGGMYSHMEGKDNTSTSCLTHVQGYKNTVTQYTASGAPDCSFVGGSENIVNASYSVVHGKGNQVTGAYNTVFGEGNQASGKQLVFGKGIRATLGVYNLMLGEGHNTAASAKQSIMLGSYNSFNASSVNSLVGGTGVQFRAQNSIGIGDSLTVPSINGVAYFGTYNISIPDAILVLGNGAKGAPSNAFYVTKSGEAYLSAQGSGNQAVVIQSTLNDYQKRILTGTTAPTNDIGNDGDIYIQY